MHVASYPNPERTPVAANTNAQDKIAYVIVLGIVITHIISNNVGVNVIYAIAKKDTYKLPYI